MDEGLESEAERAPESSPSPSSRPSSHPGEEEDTSVPAPNVRGEEEDEGTSAYHRPDRFLSPSEARNAVEAAEEEGPGVDESTEHLTVSVQVQMTNTQPGNVRHDNEVLTSPPPEQLVTDGPVSADTQAAGQPVRRSQRQTTLNSAFLPPPPSLPQLPNLALAALERLAESNTHKDDSIDDFRPLNKKRKLAPESEENCEETDEGHTCSICFEPWSNSGGHRIASLKCGHLFGLNCIEKWVKGPGGGKCPQCNAKAKKADIRVIFAKTIAVVDTTERDRALKERYEEKAQRITAQKAEAQAVLQYQLTRAECDRLKEELRITRQELEMFTSRGTQSSDCTSSSVITTASVPATVSDCSDADSRYVLCKTLPVAPNGGARVLAHDPSLNILVVSKPSSNQLLPGYGLMKYDTLDLGSHGQYVAAHTGVIRDAVFSPRGDGLVLTAGMDKTCRLTSIHSNSNVLTYKTPGPVWACTWNVDDPNYLYAGLNGSICVYDVRNTTDSVSSLQTEGERVPITSLSYVPLCRVSTLTVGGLLAGTLTGGVFWQRATNEETFTPHPLDTIPGNCTCLSFEPATRHCMASFRPPKRLPGSLHSTHVLCQLCNVPQDQPFSCRPIHQFTGGTSHRLLSRSRLFRRPGNDSRILAAFGVEEHKSVHIWNASTMTKLQELSIPHGPALDITPLSSGERDLLAVLSETTLSLFQWQHA